jgi:uncharacterized protein
METSGGALMHNLVLFGRMLRTIGLDVNSGRVMDAAAALAHVQIANKTDFYNTLRCLLVHRRDDITLFDQAFDLFWRKPPEGERIDLPGFEMIRKTRDTLIVPPMPEQRQAQDRADAPEAEADQKLIELTQLPSASEQLRSKDFADMSAAEIEAIKRVIAAMIWQLGQRRTRRMKSGDARGLDLRRTLRAAMRSGGEYVALLKREPRVRPRPIVVIADISGSMERYSKLLLHFVYALAEGMDQRVEAFVFATRLTRITRALNHREVEEALRRVSAEVKDWSGGTKIGEAIKTFNFQWGRRVLNGGAVAIVISDGWDCGEPALLGREMERLRGTCRRVVWLNPLLGAPEYAPETRGMQAALPHIDQFLPVHNLISLEQLARQLAGL